MAQSLYTAMTGMRTQQQNINTIANNIANINTVGYKSSRVSFVDAAYQTVKNMGDMQEGEAVTIQRGSGSLVDSTIQDMSEGSLLETGRRLDLALNKNGFFSVENSDGSTGYVRGGNFQSRFKNGLNFLTTSDGRFVLDTDRGRISSESSFEQASIDIGGRVSLDGKIIASLGIYSFSNSDGLMMSDDGTFKPTIKSGEANRSDAMVRQGCLESSNMDLGTEMTRLMTAQRTYALLGRAISTVDEMRQTENDIRR